LKANIFFRYAAVKVNHRTIPFLDRLRTDAETGLSAV
jgi:hypothetical protein